MAADYTSFFIEIEGSSYFEKNTLKRLRIAKDAVSYFEGVNDYEKLKPISAALSEYNERQKSKAI